MPKARDGLQPAVSIGADAAFAALLIGVGLYANGIGYLGGLCKHFGLYPYAFGFSVDEVMYFGFLTGFVFVFSGVLGVFLLGLWATPSRSAGGTLLFPMRWTARLTRLSRGYAISGMACMIASLMLGQELLLALLSAALLLLAGFGVWASPAQGPSIRPIPIRASNALKVIGLIGLASGAAIACIFFAAYAVGGSWGAALSKAAREDGQLKLFWVDVSDRYPVVLLCRAGEDGAAKCANAVAGRIAISSAKAALVIDDCGKPHLVQFGDAAWIIQARNVRFSPPGALCAASAAEL